MPSTRPRAISPLLLSPGALRAHALVILATLQVGLTAAMSGPVAVAPAAIERPGALDLAVAFAEQPAATAFLNLGTPAPSQAPKPIVRTSPAPVSKAQQPAPKVTAKGRYIPTGTGMWTYMWGETEGGSAKKIVERAQRTGLSHLYVRTGTRKGGFDGGPVLKKLLPATKGTGIQVIAWDFPQLKNPTSDARRLAAAARFRVPGAPRIMAVAPDIETGSEGTILTNARVETYMRTLRRLLPKDVSIIGVTPWPSEKRIGRYPFGGVAKYSDALAPMAYWVNRDPATVARQTMERLKKYGKPVMPIGQAYDPRIDVPGLKWGPPSQAQVTAFLETSDKYGAPATSLWVWQFASKGQWTALSKNRQLFAADK
ncbi:MAG TPA: hypothetical protein VNQ77_01445 [Frankiaceae bacterium]|nr:hypothetical protein [Frankiaceae bacterium]